MSKKLLWVLDFIGSDVPTPETSPKIPEEMVVVAESHFVVVEGSHSEVENLVRDYPYWRNSGHPQDGKWVGSGGNEVYIADGYIVDSAMDVLEARNVKIDGYVRFYADDVLENLGRVF